MRGLATEPIGVPHPIPYQGSKRWIAKAIVSCLARNTVRLVEPFAGSAAVSLAAALHGKARRFWLNDLNKPLMELWRRIINSPQELTDKYGQLWLEQQGKQREYYDRVRAEFNQTHQPHLFLYLLARCVKAAIRYNARGEFNNSPDNRRLGAHPDTMAKHILAASSLLRGRTRVTTHDFREVLEHAVATDVVYMDPPYQGVCGNRDQRYLKGVGFEDFAEALQDLNNRGVPYIVSYDGRTGEKTHGRPLPQSLELLHLEVEAGRSTQATLLGRKCDTVESLYLSPALMERIVNVPALLGDKPKQLALAFGAE